MKQKLPKKVLYTGYISTHGRDGWSYGIWNAFNDAEKRNKKYKLKKLREEEFGNAIFAISLKLEFLPFIVKRINEEKERLISCVYNGNKDNDNNDRHSLDVPNDIKYPLLIDIDSLIFELRSCCELMEKAAKKLSRYLKNVFKINLSVAELPQKQWLSANWYKRLKEIRKDIFHYSTPYLDIDISNEQQYDLLFPTAHMNDYSTKTKFFRLSEITKIYDGFKQDSTYLEKYIINQISQLH